MCIGTLLGLMGPSGCGKTTLLNILSRRLTSSFVTREQTLNGYQIDDATLRTMSTYVEQEDHLIGSLTVYETIDFAAKLALPDNISSAERRERTEEMLKDFGLVSVKDN
jgi:ABC-type multidrug transport system ATPase subunit